MNEEEVQAIKADLEAANSQVKDLNAQLGDRDAKLGEIQAVTASQSEAISAKEQELATARARIDEQEHLLAESSEALGSAIVRYRESVAAANSDVPAEMITGESIADIDASLEMSKALVTKVKASLSEQAKAIPVPAGAPERSSPDFSSMSAREKIEYAIRKETE